jgi:hypothetical protein
MTRSFIGRCVHRRRVAKLLIAAALGALPAAAARGGIAVVHNYVGPSGGNWSVGTNWLPSGSPQTGEGANISLAPTSAFSVNLDQNYTSATGLQAVTLNSSSTFSLTLNQTLAADSLFSTNDDIGLNGQATHNQTAATNSGSGLALGFFAGGSGTYLLSGTGAVSFASESVGGAGAGLFSQSAGSNTTSAAVTIGQLSTGNGSYSLSGTGALHAAGGESVGSAGVGNFNQSGGTNTDDVDLNVAANSGSTGGYTLSGGSLAVSGNLIVGGTSSAAGGAGSFTLSGGTRS